MHPDEEETHRYMEELDNRLGIELNAKGVDSEWDHTMDHQVAGAVSEAALQFALALARTTAEPCACEPDGSCATANRIKLLLTGILLPQTALFLGKSEPDKDHTMFEVIEEATYVAEKLHSHARASIGKPL